MRTPADRAWQRIQEAAIALSAQRSIPSSRHAEAIVWQILREEDIEQPPEAIIASLVQELLQKSKPAPQ